MSQSLESTATLLQQVVDGSDQARERLCQHFLPILTRWAHGRLPNYARDLSDTQDLVQTAPIRALDQVDSFESLREGAFLAYLRTTLLNHIRMEIRRVTRRNRHGFADSELEPTDPEASVLSEAIGLDVLERYEAALMTLTDKAREAVMLRVEFGYSFPEIAAATETLGQQRADAGIALAGPAGRGHEMSRRKGPPDLRARSILERLAGSSDALEELADDSESLAERLKEIEQLFVLHGGERGPSADKAQRPKLFSWGHLRVLEKIGEGSFGEVFRAYDGILDRDVALKLLKTGLQRPFQSQLFLHEARQLAMVRHPNVLAVHGAAVHDGRPGLWSDLIEGATLSDSEALLGNFVQDDWLELIESLCSGLQAVHEAGLLHGDVKPSNIMRDRHGVWVLMDFGASLDRKPDQGGPAMTSGTPLYMAPEAVLGQPPTTAADLYALGATLYRAISGQPVHAADDWDSLAALHKRADAIDFGPLDQRVDRRVSELVRSLLARSPEDRPDPAALLATIQSIRTAPQRRFRRLAIAAVTGSLAFGLALTSWGLIEANQARAVAEQEQRNTAAVNDFLQRLLSAPDESGRVRDMTVEEMLDFAARDVQKQLEGQPEAQAAVHLALAESYEALSLPEQALEQVRLGLDQLGRIEPLNPTLHPALELEAVAALETAGEHEQSLARAESFEVSFRGRLPAESDWFLIARKYQVTNLLALNRLDEAEQLLDRLMARLPGPEQASNNLGFTLLAAQANLHRERGRFNEAIAASQAALDWLDRYPRERPNNRANTLIKLALALNLANRKLEALEVLEPLFELQARLHGEGSPQQISTLINRGAIQYELGDLEAALASADQALAMIERDPELVPLRDRLSLQANRANLLTANQQYDQGEALMRRLMTEVRKDSASRTSSICCSATT